MKRLVLFVAIALTVCNSKSNAQTSIPFYGFELSNYEVGDTLEYNFTDVAQGGHYRQDTIIWIFLEKEFTNDSTIVYTMKEIVGGRSWHMGPTNYYFLTDTIQRVITNDAILENNDNNLLDDPLMYCNSLLYPDCTTVFDTVNTLKHLYVLNLMYPPISYEAFENLGITQYSRNGGFYTVSYELRYANLNHYGVYGTLVPVLPDGAIEDTSSTDTLSVTVLQLTYDSDSKALFFPNTYLEEELTMYNANGQLVIRSRLNENPLYVGELFPGVYFYSVIGHQPVSGKLWIR